MKIKALLFTTFLLFAAYTIGQETKGVIKYDVFVSSDDPAMSAYVDQMENSALEMYFSENNTRSDFFMGEMMTTKTISASDKDTTLVLLDGMMGKIAMKVTEDDMDDEQRMAMEKQEVELIAGETKEVMGYECNKAIIVGADEQESVVWYTTEILPAHREGEYLFEEIPGLPLELHSSRGKMNFKIVAYSFKGKVKKADEVFSQEIPKGFTLKTVEEMKQFGGR
ncbi:hypothetical protein CW751_13520 [Brumimicrobium salinarum]|uniref:Uncharacterized protein n=1 Tax=Brumimicrobium salinarum TaxID=2058658 RepID=A0A2I0QZJ6_9FLAO|nr:DUF4412 domain-containing protein [Brumimicrobium salinarum]PKR79739.1 hypothetical protein CW751_13520 [Brumimicrobium salinarum]